VPKTAPLTPRRPRDREPFFLVKCHESCCCPPTHPLFHHFCRPKMASHDLCARSFEDGCLCSISHGPLQLQIWTAFLLPARLFPTAARQSATQLSHTNFSQLSEPTQGESVWAGSGVSKATQLLVLLTLAPLPLLHH
jgi:hypothetical protein